MSININVLGFITTTVKEEKIACTGLYYNYCKRGKNREIDPEAISVQENFETGKVLRIIRYGHLKLTMSDPP